MSDVWRKCSSCRNPIGFRQRFFSCSVSTCNRPRVALYFCSVSCWEAHLPEARHREAWAEEKMSPSQEEAAREEAADEAPRRKVVPPPAPAAGGSSSGDVPRDVLIVVSKLKAYVKARTGLNTSDSVTNILSEQVRRLCDLAARRAESDGRKTLMDRDFRPSDVSDD